MKVRSLAIVVAFFMVSSGTRANGDGPALFGNKTYFAVNFGVVADGSSNDTIALQGALDAVAAAGGALVLPPGRILLAANETLTIPAGICVKLTGQGQDTTILDFTDVNGLTVTYGGPTSCLTANDFSLVTSDKGKHSGITLIYGSANSNPANTPQSNLTNIGCHGHDGYALASYWGTCYDVVNVSNVNFTNTSSVGSGSNGVGISLAGLSGASAYGVAYNVQGCLFEGLAKGIVYGSYVQGVTINQSNFTGGGTGIAIDGNAGLLVQLSVQASQFGGLAVAVDAHSTVSQVNLNGNTVLPPVNGVGFRGRFVAYSISGNTFNYNSGGTLANKAIDLQSGSNFGVITANQIAGMAVGVSMGGANANLQSNSYNANRINYTGAGTNGNVAGGGSP